MRFFMNFLSVKPRFFEKYFICIRIVPYINNIRLHQTSNETEICYYFFRIMNQTDPEV